MSPRIRRFQHLLLSLNGGLADFIKHVTAKQHVMLAVPPTDQTLPPCDELVNKYAQMVAHFEVLEQSGYMNVTYDQLREKIDRYKEGIENTAPKIVFRPVGKLLNGTNVKN